VIGVAKTSRGLLVFAVPGSWGDWYEVALFDDQLCQLATDEDELHEEQDIVTSLVTLGLVVGLAVPAQAATESKGTG